MALTGQKRIGLYIHIPFCIRKCLYCAFYSEPVGKFDTFRVVSAIIKEIVSYGKIVPATIYIGGGSPSALPRTELLSLVEKTSALNPNLAEFTVEVNPAQVDIELLKALRSRGVNRLSIGSQSFNEDELKLLGRTHSSDDIAIAVQAARQAGFDNISLDLIFAIPGSTKESWQRSLTAAADLSVEHISAYSLTYEKDTPMSTARDSGKLLAVDEDADRQMYEQAIDFLASAGFAQYEISNFAKPGFECKHNLTYWQNDEYIGVGPAAGSYYNGQRTMNIAAIDGYLEAIKSDRSTACQTQGPDKEDTACETMVLGLRMTDGVQLAEYEKKTGLNAEKIFTVAINQHTKDGLLEVVNGRLRLTRAALPIADTVLCDFATI